MLKLNSLQNIDPNKKKKSNKTIPKKNIEFPLNKTGLLL